MVPKPFRKAEREAYKKKREESKVVVQPNPATYFILMFLLIGSFGIHFINLRRTYTFDSRQAENRIAMLREVLKRVQAGEDVDVERALGTGDLTQEQDWEEGTLQLNIF